MNFNSDSTMMLNLNSSQRGKFKLTFLGSGSAFTVGDDNGFFVYRVFRRKKMK